VSRRAQPYRKGSPLRTPGMALSAMLKGRTASGHNPKDLERNVQMLMRAKKSPKRPARPARPPRPPR
jgi:hypothetical protein